MKWIERNKLGAIALVLLIIAGILYFSPAPYRNQDGATGALMFAGMATFWWVLFE